MTEFVHDRSDIMKTGDFDLTTSKSLDASSPVLSAIANLFASYAESGGNPGDSQARNEAAVTRVAESLKGDKSYGATEAESVGTANYPLLEFSDGGNWSGPAELEPAAYILFVPPKGTLYVGLALGATDDSLQQRIASRYAPWFERAGFTVATEIDMGLSGENEVLQYGWIAFKRHDQATVMSQDVLPTDLGILREIRQSCCDDAAIAIKQRNEQFPHSWDGMLQRIRHRAGEVDLAVEETNYKLELATGISAARTQLQAGDRSWFETLSTALRKKNNNLIDYRPRDRFLVWCKQNTETAARLLTELWRDSEPVVERVHAFLGGLPPKEPAGPGARLDLVSTLLLGTQATASPPIRQTVFAKAFECTGKNLPSKKPESEFYRAALEYLDELVNRAREEGMPNLANRLEAQGAVYSTIYHANELWILNMPTEPKSIQNADNFTTLKPVEHKSLTEMPQRGRNVIMFGAPGTGKTHRMRRMFDEYTDLSDVVDHDTWLQSLLNKYGWRPVIAATLAKLKTARVPELREHPWIQLKSMQRGKPRAALHQTIWSYLQAHTPEDVEIVKAAIRRPPFIFSRNEEIEWRLLENWRELDLEAAELSDLLKAGPSAGGQAVHRYRVVTFHPSFSYEDFIRGIRPVSVSEDGTTQFRVVDGVFKQICDEARANPSKPYALFIDEINRANIAKVFGELITLIESDKRTAYDAEGRLIRGMEVQLAGGSDADNSERPFGVPENLDIFGTMNTADRSIALLDVALRRRFEFQEIEPDYALLGQVDHIDLGKLLRRINDRLMYLRDSDHRIGHAYLMKATSLADLRRIFRVQIIPLLQEYFFDDIARVGRVLATTNSSSPFVMQDNLSFSDLFPGTTPERGDKDRPVFRITDESTWTEESFRGIYRTSDEAMAPSGAE